MTAPGFLLFFVCLLAAPTPSSGDELLRPVPRDQRAAIDRAPQMFESPLRLDWA